MDDLVSEFLIECYDNLQQVDQDLLALEENPGNRDNLDSVFRTIHTIKGTCGFLDFSKLELITHKGENLLDKLRTGELVLKGEITNALLRMVDSVRQILDCIESTREEGDADNSDVIRTLDALLIEAGGVDTEPSADSDLARISPSAPEPPPSLEAASSGAPAPINSPPTVPKKSHTLEAPVPENPQPAREPADSAAGAKKSSGSVAESTIRVGVHVLDQLMDLVGELVLARNQVVQCIEEAGVEDLLGTSQRLDLITTELQGQIMKTRMQPIGSIWNKFPRVVRDLAQSCGKKVRLEMDGKGTEVDKTLIEAIKDPLLHVVRNSVDHGVESPDVRRENGKPEEGCITLRAFHEGGMVNIEITDDGAGINLKRVKNKAVERGIATGEQVAHLSERDLISLILTPGFSTAETVTSVSGRGVGMDVVRTNIEKIGGSVDVYTVEGRGTTLKIKIPLTLAIIPALIVTCGGQRFALPQASLRELVRLEGETVRTGIEDLYGAPVYRLRGKLLPLVYLNKELRLEDLPAEVAGETSEPEVINIVVLDAADRSFGLVVDQINDTQEIVVKPLGTQLSKLACYAGSTIMGDGTVALILDAAGLARGAHVTSGEHKTTFSHDRHQENDSEKSQGMLLFRVQGEGRMAIPVTLLSRLEEVDRSDLEFVGGQVVVQYRGGIMQLIDLCAVLPERGRLERNQEDGHESDSVPVLVFSNRGKNIGIMVERVLDIIDEKVTLQGKASGAGLLGVSVLDGRVTELLDVDHVIRECDSDFFETESEEELV